MRLWYNIVVRFCSICTNSPTFIIFSKKLFSRSNVARPVQRRNRNENHFATLRKKKNGDLWKNIFRIVTQPREQSQTSTSRTNAWQEAFGKCSMPNRNPSRTHSPKARVGGHDIVKFTGKPFWRRTFVKKKPFRVVGSFFVV